MSEKTSEVLLSLHLKKQPYICAAMKKIMIIGCGGAGKSTLARELGERLSLEVIHLDQLYWTPNWVPQEKEDWEQMVTDLSNKPSWILDGNYGGTMDIRLAKADTIVFLDRSKWLCMYRVLKRLFASYGQTRVDMAEGCRERFSFEFLHYIFFYNQTRRAGILKKLNQASSSQTVFHLQNKKDIQLFLTQMEDAKGGTN